MTEAQAARLIQQNNLLIILAQQQIAAQAGNANAALVIATRTVAINNAAMEQNGE